jgi:hypothetical protein
MYVCTVWTTYIYSSSCVHFVIEYNRFCLALLAPIREIGSVYPTLTIVVIDLQKP